MRGGSCSACVSESWNEGAASFRQMVSADQSNRQRGTHSLRGGLWEGGSGTSCPLHGHSLETSLWAGTLTQVSLSRDGGPIFKSLEENKQVMGKVDLSCLFFGGSVHCVM